ncbi:MAG: hypothetical protein AAFU85_18850 [Planctomycetota bacterium]
MSKASEDADVNPFTPTAYFIERAVARQSHPARWVLIAVGCLLATPLLDALTSLRSGTIQPSAIPRLRSQ